MKDSIEFTRPAFLDQPTLRDYLEQLHALQKENQQLLVSLQPLLLALADIAPNTQSLVRAYRVRLGEAERLSGRTIQPLIPID